MASASNTANNHEDLEGYPQYTIDDIVDLFDGHRIGPGWPDAPSSRIIEQLVAIGVRRCASLYYTLLAMTYAGQLAPEVTAGTTPYFGAVMVDLTEAITRLGGTVIPMKDVILPEGT
ncbi:MAG: hypothetical protein NTW79_02700 [Candidatus Berkelbacteria bacterium]|nr:hypothetical protein [Candidatus Berkelbacteria bacterium]